MSFARASLPSARARARAIASAPSPASIYDAAKLPDQSTHIRLLHLLPPEKGRKSESKSALRCTISTAEIESPPAFKALSYMWGPPDQPRKMLHISGTDFDVTESLDTALRHFRHPSEVITLWIDQVCINQEDIPEKNHQVALMSKVYGKASEVLVWLGEAADGSDKLMDAWLTLGQRADVLQMKDYYTPERLPTLQAMFNDDERDDDMTRQFRALAREASLLLRGLLPAMEAWYERPWFTRVWVVQELSLNQKPFFFCGSKRISAWHVLMCEQLLEYGYTTFLSKQSDAPSMEEMMFLLTKPTPAFFSLWRRRQRFDLGEGTGDSLLRLLKKLFVDRGMNATDQRDRVYALLGLAVDREELGIQPEYGNHDIGLVLAKAASALIRQGHLEVLSYSQFPKSVDGLPSWVPDWRSQLRPSFYPAPSGDDGTPLFAAGGSGPPVLIPVDGKDNGVRKLGLRGYTVDVIEETGEEWENADWKEENYVTFNAFIRRMRAMHEASTAKDKPIYKSEARRAEAVWRVPIADMSYDKMTSTTRARAELEAHRYNCFDKFCDVMARAPTITEPEVWIPMFQAAREAGEEANWYKLNMANVKGMKPFLTVEGYLGMAVAGARAGDVVVVFEGGRVPYVLRRVGTRGRERKSEFEFVGEAYCDGVMDGEMLGKPLAEDFILV